MITYDSRDAAEVEARYHLELILESETQKRILAEALYPYLAEIFDKENTVLWNIDHPRTPGRVSELRWVDEDKGGKK